jgi:hypothetical protein
MKIKLIDSRGIWLDGKQQASGYESTVADVTGAALIKSGLAVEVNDAKVESKKPKAKFNAD